VITPRITRLVRARDLRGFRQAIRARALSGGVEAARRRAVIVPSRTAAEQLRRMLEEAALAGPASAIVLPHLVTRDGWRAIAAGSAASHGRPLSPHEREVLLGAAAREAVAAGAVPPFSVRPGLLALMLEFYDGLRRNLKSVDDFERLVAGRFEDSQDSDGGAVRMLAQTRFLAAAFRAYEARLGAIGAVDEHGLRQQLLDDGPPVLTHVIVAVGDRAGDPHGLWLADFDLLARQAGVERLDVVATEAMLAAGYGERLRALLPGIEDEPAPADAVRPSLVSPSGIGGPLFFTYRDREEELRGVARRIKRRHGAPDAAPLWKSGVVFRRPLPYVYLAGQIFPAAGVPYQAFDALPLASEAYAAALDLIVECLDTAFARAPLVALLRSPALAFTADGRPLPSAAVSALDRQLAEARYLGDAAELARLVSAWTSGLAEDPGQRGAGRLADAVIAGKAAVDAGSALRGLADDDRPSSQIERLLAYLDAHEPAPPGEDEVGERMRRARGAILGSLRGLRDAHRLHDDPPRAFRETAAAIRRWIEGQTFAPRRGRDGVQLLDADAARFGDFDVMYLVGLTQGEWPGSERVNVFYRAGVLADLGWPAEADARAADRAAFEDLVSSAGREVVVSTFTLEHDVIVEQSPCLEDLPEAALPASEDAAPGGERIFVDEALMGDPATPDPLSEPAARWLAIRRSRTDAAAPIFRGRTFDPALPAYKVSSLDLYLGCPFAYFATHVLRLEEDLEDEEALGPRTQGKLVHAVLQQFYEAWQADGLGAITADNIALARRRFAEIVDGALAGLPDADAALVRVRMLGSPVAPGYGETVFRLEAEHPVPVVERLLEFELNADAPLRTAGGVRRIPLRAVADRIDLLADGTFRVFDYKLTKAPDKRDVVQLPAYAACAVTKLEGRHGRTWRASEAAYIAFGKVAYAPLAPNAEGLDEALREGEARLVEAVANIERGEFPAKPRKEFRCTYCPFTSVCRKEIADAE